LKKKVLVLTVALAVLVLSGSAAFAYMLGNPETGVITKWEPGVGTASIVGSGGTLGNPGGATWSIMPAGIQNSYGDDLHPSTALSTNLSDLFFDALYGSSTFDTTTGLWHGTVEDQINMAFDAWSAVSGFTNLMQDEDGGSFNGLSEEGDIRIGAYANNLLEGTIVNGDTFFPGVTGTATNGFGPFDSIGGDMHFNNDQNAAYPDQVYWVNDPTDTGVGGDRSIDLFTVLLHEAGHALGLDHSEYSTSVMALYSVRGGALRTLQADDIAGIQALYGPATAAIPEPGTVVLLGIGLVGLGVFRKRFHG
jgi:hypothetical protein